MFSAEYGLLENEFFCFYHSCWKQKMSSFIVFLNLTLVGHRRKEEESGCKCWREGGRLQRRKSPVQGSLQTASHWSLLEFTMHSPSPQLHESYRREASRDSRRAPGQTTVSASLPLPPPNGFLELWHTVSKSVKHPSGLLCSPIPTFDHYWPSGEGRVGCQGGARPPSQHGTPHVTRWSQLEVWL